MLITLKGDNQDLNLYIFYYYKITPHKSLRTTENNILYQRHNVKYGKGRQLWWIQEIVVYIYDRITYLEKNAQGKGKQL